MKWTKFYDAPFIFIFLALIFGILFVRILPPLWGVDEITHFNRAYQISEGTFLEQKLQNGKSYGGAVPANLVNFSGYTYKDLIDNPQVDNLTVTKGYENQYPSSITKNYDFSGAEVYPPFVYAAPAGSIWLGRIFHANLGQIIFAARSATLLLYTAIVFIALFLLRDKKSKWLVFLIALFPMTLSQAATVSADSLAISLSLLLFALFVNAANKSKLLNWRELAVIMIIGLLLALVKPIYIMLALVAVFLPQLPGKKMSRRQQIILRLAMALVLIIPVIAWDLNVKGVAEATAAKQLNSTAIHNVHLGTQLLYVLEHPIAFIRIVVSNVLHQDWYSETFGLLGWNYVKIPSIITGILIASLTLISFCHLQVKEKKWWTGWVFFVSAVLTILGFMVFFYTSFTTLRSNYISGVQGRYFIPALPFLFYALGNLIRSIRVSIGDYTATALFSLVSIVSLTTSIVVYHSITYK